MEMDDKFFRHVLDNLHEGVYFVDRERKITYWNKGAERIAGYSAAQMLGHHCSDNTLVHVDQDGVNLCKGGFCPVAIAMTEGAARRAEVFLRHKDGHRVPVVVYTTPIRDAGGEITGSVEIFSENEPSVLMAMRIEELQKMALLDPLTEVGNRRYCEMNLNARLSELERYGLHFGVLFVDIDRFKEVNDAYGHDTGDRVLRMAAKTLLGAIRSFDVVCRWGGEEFLITLVNIQRDSVLLFVANKLRALVENSGLSHDGNHLRVTVSIGATLAVPQDTMDSLVKRADELMYRSKTKGGNHVSPSLTV